MKKPLIDLKERTSYDIIVITFDNGARISIQTTKTGFEVTNSSLGDTTMFIKPSMGNAFEVRTGELK